MLSTLAINCQGNFRIFMLASEIHQQKKTQESAETFVYCAGNSFRIPLHFAKSYDFIFEPFQLDEKHQIKILNLHVRKKRRKLQMNEPKIFLQQALVLVCLHLSYL